MLTTDAPGADAPQQGQSEGQSPSQQTPAPATYTVKVDGRPVTLTLDQLIEKAQVGVAATKRFQEAAQMREEALAAQNENQAFKAWQQFLDDDTNERALIVRHALDEKKSIPDVVRELSLLYSAPAEDDSMTYSGEPHPQKADPRLDEITKKLGVFEKFVEAFAAERQQQAAKDAELKQEQATQALMKRVSEAMASDRFMAKYAKNPQKIGEIIFAMQTSGVSDPRLIVQAKGSEIAEAIREELSRRGPSDAEVRQAAEKADGSVPVMAALPAAASQGYKATDNSLKDGTLDKALRSFIEARGLKWG